MNQCLTAHFVRLSAIMVLAVTPQGLVSQTAGTTKRPESITVPWYVRAAAIHRVTLKPPTSFWRFEHLSLHEPDTSSQLGKWRDDGIDAIEIFAPEEGGNSYDGLDAKNRYALDPGIGTMDEFRNLVQQAHSMGIAVVTFQNFGYAAIDAPQFMKAEDDVRSGRVTGESQFFYWSDQKDTPPPAKGDSYFLIRPATPGYDPTKTEFWQWSDRAQHFYWTRWPGKDGKGERTHLPQYNWSGPDWPGEAANVVDFWMKSGLDGVVADAVNWYVGYDWQKNADFLKAVRKYSGAKLTIPEGGGAFHTDDPVGWIRDGGWTGLYDYGLDIWWEKQSRPMERAIESGNPGIFEEALRGYHDRVVAAGGVLIQPVLNMHDQRKQRLEEALIAVSGDMLCYCEPSDSIVRPADGIPALLKLKKQHPALYQNSTRRRVATDQNQSIYATLRYAADRSEQVVAVFNFSADPVDVNIDARAIEGSVYRDLLTKETQTPAPGQLNLRLSGYGYRIFGAAKQ